VNTNFNDADLESWNKTKKFLPDLILVRKAFPNRRKKNHRRAWKLKDLPKEPADLPVKKNEAARAESDYESFLQDLEEDPSMRAQINLFKVPNAEEIKKQTESVMVDEGEGEEDEGEFPDVGLEELMEDLSLGDDSDELVDVG